MFNLGRFEVSLSRDVSHFMAFGANCGPAAAATTTLLLLFVELIVGLFYMEIPVGAEEEEEEVLILAKLCQNNKYFRILTFWYFIKYLVGHLGHLLQSTHANMQPNANLLR